MSKHTKAPMSKVIAPKPESRLPAGVQMHNSGVSPYATIKALPDAPDPKKPPPGWQGSYATCGWCGDFVRGDRCPTCAPDSMPDHIINSGAPKMMAR